ncbi:hypothetical protein SL929_22095 [Klebsiella pneumoniae]
MKPMKNLLLMGLLSALGAGGALAAERSTYRKLKNQSIPLSTPYAT